jgi:hypothetical protein
MYPLACYGPAFKNFPNKCRMQKGPLFSCKKQAHKIRLKQGTMQMRPTSFKLPVQSWIRDQQLGQSQKIILEKR